MSSSAANLVPAQDLTEHRPPVNTEQSPLSFAQQRLWFLDQLQSGDPAYNIPQAWRLSGPLNLPAFLRALDAVASRHETLRTTFRVSDGQPVQLVSPARPMPLVLTDLSSEQDPETEVQRRIACEAQQPFDLQQGPLWRVSIFRLRPDEHQVLFNLHHIIADAWSFEILRREVTALYEAFCAGGETPLPELPIQYLDFACWQRDQMRGDRMRAELEFWQPRLAGERPAIELPFDHPRTSRPGCGGCSAPFELSRAATASLKELGRREGATLFMVLLAAFNTFLHRLTGQDDFVVGAPSSGRDRTETEGLIGLFVNTLALRTDTSGDPTFLELLARVRETVLDAFAHQEMPFEELVKALQPERAAGQNPLFQTVLALQNGYPNEWPLGNLRATLVEVETPTAKFDWTLLLEETDCGLKGRLEYKTDLFEAESIACFLQQFRFLLEGIAARPQLRLSEFPLLNEAGRRQVLEDWNPAATAYERDACIHELFETQAQKCPDAIALVCGDRQLTYQELNERANRLAQRLKKLGAGPEVLVGLCLDRSWELIVAMLAILKSGAAYVPLDRAYPRERLEFMLRDAKASLIVTNASFDSPAEPPVRGRRQEAHSNQPEESLSLLTPAATELKIIRLDSTEKDSLEEPAENFRSGAGPENLAYVMYTSGSTGTPKGVAIPHRGVVRLVRHTNYVTFSANDVFLQLAPVSFDASTFEIWGCLLNGGKLVIFPPHPPSLEELGRMIRQHSVTILWLTAGLFHQMVDLQLHSLKSVRQLLAGGDVLSAAHVQRAASALPGCRLINGYGPTENTTFTCCCQIPSGWQGQAVPIGRPISNTRVYVLDKNLAPVPVRVPGELCIGGDGLARGYWQRPELTAEKFVADPFHPNDSRGRLYRTGDIVRWRTDGQLEFLGRSDQQVKIRGFRVEPGEIEAALAQHPAVRAAAVVARDLTGSRQLVAYVVLDPAIGVDLTALSRFLEDKLPAWMVPARFVELKELPLTANGKVDRRALPEPDAAEPSRPFAPPRNSSEETLLRIWREVLGRNSFGIHENFFHLGGHSLLATQMISRISKAFQVEVPVRAIFETPTIAGLAEAVGRNTGTVAGASAIPRRIRRAQARHWLKRIDTLSDAEVETLLSSPDLKQP